MSPRHPFDTPRRRPTDIPAGTSMLEEARLTLERHREQQQTAAALAEAARDTPKRVSSRADVGSPPYPGMVTAKSDVKVEEPDGAKAEEPRRAHTPGQR